MMFVAVTKTIYEPLYGKKEQLIVEKNSSAVLTENDRNEYM